MRQRANGESGQPTPAARDGDDLEAIASRAAIANRSRLDRLRSDDLVAGVDQAYVKLD